MDSQKNKLIKHCFVNSERKWETALMLMKTKRYADALFFCHLTLEFFLKGKIVEETGAMYPFTHDLLDLAKKADLLLAAEHKRQLSIINTFNIAGRYDDYKHSFYKKATSAYAKKYFVVTQDILLWLKKN